MRERETKEILEDAFEDVVALVVSLIAIFVTRPEGRDLMRLEVSLNACIQQREIEGVIAPLSIRKKAAEWYTE